MNNYPEGSEQLPIPKTVGRFLCTDDLYDLNQVRVFTKGLIYIGYETPKGLAEFELINDYSFRTYITEHWAKYFVKQ